MILVGKGTEGKMSLGLRTQGGGASLWGVQISSRERVGTFVVPTLPWMVVNSEFTLR